MGAFGRFVAKWVFSAIAIAVAAALMPGITHIGTDPAWLSFLFVALFLVLVNSLVKPVLSILSLPVTILTLGVFQLVLNAFMLVLASSLAVNVFGSGIRIDGFGAAFFGSIVVSVVSCVLEAVGGTD